MDKRELGIRVARYEGDGKGGVIKDMNIAQCMAAVSQVVDTIRSNHALKSVVETMLLECSIREVLEVIESPRVNG